MNHLAASGLVFLGGGAGAVLRYLLGVLFRSQQWNLTFPWHTFLINAFGSFALGVIAAQFKDRTSTAYLLLGTGVCGGFTTFSAFSLETIELLDASPLRAGFYVVGSVLAAIAGAWLGLRLAG